MLAAIMILGAGLSAILASTKNRNVVGWMIAGLCFPAISIIVLACQPALPAPGATPPELPGSRAA
jgi:hypothetical protein